MLVNLPKYKKTKLNLYTLNSLYSFSISDLRKSGFFLSEKTARLTLFNNSSIIGFVLVKGSIDNKKLELMSLIVGEKCRKLDVGLIESACNYGGVRYWFKCPLCNTKRSRLYLHNQDIKCRNCVGIPYQSQNETKSDRLMRRARSARRKLGANNNLLHPLNGKPKGMHWKTYFQLSEIAKNII